jgi:hypothetical protein
MYGRVKERRITTDEMDILVGEDTVKFIKSPPSEMVWSCGKNAKPANAKTNCSSEDGRSKEKRKSLCDMEEREWRGFNL